MTTITDTRPNCLQSHTSKLFSQLRCSVATSVALGVGLAALSLSALADRKSPPGLQPYGGPTTRAPLQVCNMLIKEGANPQPLPHGQPITVTVMVMNAGNGPCEPGKFPGTIVRNNQPEGLTFVVSPKAITESGGSATWVCGYGSPVHNFSCATQSSIPPGYSATFKFKATVQSSASPGGSVVNCAKVTNQHDANPVDNEHCTTLRVGG